MANIYCWMNVSSPECTTTSSSIVCIGNESKCVDFCKDATLDTIRKDVQRMVNLFSRLKVQRLEIQLHAGEGETEVFKNFHVQINYRR